MADAKKTTDKLVKTEKAKQEISAAIKDQDISDKIFKRVVELENAGGLDFPANYSYANALKSAWLMLQETKDRSGNLVLNTCTKQSIANAMLDMVIQGLSPAKKQCYFIAYGKSLQLSRSYMGTVAVTKRLTGIKNVAAQLIYEGDEFEYTIDFTNGSVKILKHEQKLENRDDSKIRAAYGIVIKNEGEPFIEIMTMDQIKKAWEQGATKGSSPAHKNFAGEMAKKSVINRACKLFFNTSDDSDLLIESINRTTDAEAGIDETQYEEIVENEIAENANQEELDLELPEGELTEEEKAEIIANEKQTSPEWA